MGTTVGFTMIILLCDAPVLRGVYADSLCHRAVGSALLSHREALYLPVEVGNLEQGPQCHPALQRDL